MLIELAVFYTFIDVYNQTFLGNKTRHILLSM